jgi:hypothetical protein
VMDAMARRCPPLGNQYGRVLLQRMQDGQNGDCVSPGFSAIPRSVAGGRDFDPASIETVAVLREAERMARKRLPHPRSPDRPIWSNNVFDCVRHAILDASSIGVKHVHWGHLFAHLSTNASDSTHEVLTKLGVDCNRLRLPDHIDLKGCDRPIAPAADVLMVIGALNVPASRTARFVLGAWRWLATSRGSVSPVVLAIELEAIRQAVRYGSEQVGPVHLLVAICTLHQQLEDLGRSLSLDVWPYNAGAAVLARWGVDRSTLSKEASHFQIPVAATDSSRRWRSRPSDPGFGRDAARVVRLAEHRADTLGHRSCGTNHLLAALLEDPSGAAHVLVENMGVNVASLANDIESQIASV